MKKIALALAIVLCFSSVAFGALAGKFGAEASNLIVANPLGFIVCGKGMFFYQFTEDVSGGVGIINVNDPIPGADTDTVLGLQIKGQFNLGRGKTIPHLGVELDYVSADISGSSSPDDTYTILNLAIMYGVEVMWIPDLSILLDARVLEYGSMDGVFLGATTQDSHVALLSGGTLGIRWYIM